MTILQSDQKPLVACLLFEKPIKIDKEAYFAALRKYCGKCEFPPSEKEDLIHAFHLDYQVKFEQGEAVAVQTTLILNNLVKLEEFESALQQSWAFPKAREVVNQCRYELQIFHLMVTGLEPAAQLALHTNVIRAALEAIPGVAAICWQGAESIVAPERFIEAYKADMAFFSGPINVRLFNIQGQKEGTIVMDTLGMAAFNLPDLQCYFEGLDPNSIAEILFSTAKYLFDYGSVIEDGHTVAGVHGQRWKCHFEESLVAPRRLVLDISTGEFDEQSPTIN